MRKFYPFAKLLKWTAKPISSRLTLFLLFGLLALSASAQTVRYVNAEAATGGDGLSWATAYKDVQAALDAAASGDEIRVAKGSYLPSVDPDGTNITRKQTFLLKSGVALLGGYNAATGVRDVRANKTILSGDLGTLGANSDNAYHVVAAKNLTAATILEGFTITGGNADNSSTTFLVDGRNSDGAAIYVYGGDANLTINDCVIENNTTLYGTFLIRNASPKVTNCVFSANSAIAGAGVYTSGSSGSSTFVNCLFERNTAVYSTSMSIGAGNTSIINSTFYKNISTSNLINGTIHAYNGGDFTITNTIIWGNTNTQANVAEGVGVSASTASTGTVAYSILDAGFGYTGSNNINATPAFDNEADANGADNIWMTADDGLHLRAASSAVNSGNNAAVSIATDITGAARKQGTVNRGAYETTKPAVTLYVNAAAAAGGDGLSWATAYKDLQSALEAAVGGDQILLAAGLYRPSKDASGNPTPANVRTKTFLLKDGVKLYGGYNAATGIRDVRTNKTQISGDLAGNDGANFINYSDNVYHVMAARNLTMATVLDGLTVTGGNANGSDVFLVEGRDYYGSGIYLYGGGTNMTINNCVIAGNTHSYGALYTYKADPKVTNCVFYANSGSGGGAVANNNNAPSFINCLFVANSAYGYAGGAIINQDADATIINCTFYNNATSATSSYGGAIYNYNGSGITVVNSIVWGNTGAPGKEGLVVDAGSGGNSATVSYSTVQGGFAGTGNLDVDPAFDKVADLDGADNIWMTADDGLHLRNSSPVIDKGSNTAISGTTSDITGATRVQNTTVNMGAYETVIVKTEQTVAFTAITDKTYGEDPFTITATATSGLPTTSYSILSGPATISGNSVTITGVGPVVVKAYQSGNATYFSAETTTTFTVNKRAVTITADAVSKTYGDDDPALTYTITSGSLKTGDAVTGSLTRDAGETVGSYAINQGSLALNSNYDLTFVGDNLAIGERFVEVTVDAVSKVFGDTDPALTYTITFGSLKSGDAFSGSLTRESGENAGSYAIKQGDLALNSNYILDFVGANLTIDPRAITIKANDASKTEGQTLTFTGSEYSLTSGSLLAGDVISSVGLSSTGAAANAAPGTYDIVPASVAGISATNYAITYANGTLTVNACPAITITTQPVAQVKCAGDNVTFTVVATGTGLTYKWYKGTDLISSGTDASLTLTGVTAANAGDYKVEVINACRTMASNVASLTVNTVAVPTITQNGNVLTSSATTGNQWYREGVELAGATAQTYQVQAGGRYTVKVASGTCSATSAEHNFVVTSVEEPSAWNGAVIAYPNPVGKTLYVKNTSGHKLQLQLVNGAGVNVRTTTLAGTQGSINVEGLAAGAYYLVVTDAQTQRSISINLIKL